MNTVNKIENKLDEKKWIYISGGSIAVSVLSLLLPVITYKDASGHATRYNVFGLLANTKFRDNVLMDFIPTNTVFNSIGYDTAGVLVTILTIIGIAAIIIAFAGIKSMTKQYESPRPFRMTMCGLIGTAIPSIVLMILSFISGKLFRGTMRLGTYIWITPLAMIIACIYVTKRHRLTQSQQALIKEASDYIRPAGDLK